MLREEIEEVLPGIYRVPVPLRGNPLKELNSYVIRGKGDGVGEDGENRGGSEGKNLLIDTGFRTESCREELLEGLSLLGLRMEDTDILVTHLHADHCGNAPDLVREGNKVYISRIDGEFILGTAGEDGVAYLHHVRVERLKKNGIDEGMIQEMLACTPSKTMAPDQRYRDYTLLDEGDELKAGDYTLKAIYTPGHTPGQMCFEILGTGAMILGDHVLFDITPNITDWPGMEDALGSYLESLDKIDQYPVTTPLPGHRKPADFHQRIRDLKAHHERRLEECYQVIRRLGKARLYEITGNMTWKIRASSWDEFPPAQRWFALGECLSHIDHLKKMNRITQHEEGGRIWYEA